MYQFVLGLHVVLCLFLILIIMLQPGKGGDVGAAFGGGGGGTSFFGPRGPASLLSRATTIVAVLFMVTSVSLTLYSDRKVMNMGGDVGDEFRIQLQEEQGNGPLETEENSIGQ